MQNELKTACQAQMHVNIIDRIMQIPQQIIAQHHTNHLADLLLYDIAHQDCLSFSKAAYLVDNPDFNAVKGICGYTNNEQFDAQQDLISQLEKSAYNSKVKQFYRPSFKANNHDLTVLENLDQLAKELEMHNPKAHTWSLKHNNYGILLFENNTPSCCDWKDSLIQKISSFFGMCGF